MIIEKLKPLFGVVAQVAGQLSIDSSLILGIIWEETKGNTWNPRFENSYYEGRKFYLPSVAAGKLGITLETEQVMQSMSWGLMQVLGVVSREEGYMGPLPQLCDPAMGIHWGASHLDRLLLRYKNTDDAISAYNQGSPRFEENGKYLNQGYVDRVKANILEIKRGLNGQ